MGAVILPVVLLALMWLLIIRPQQHRLRAQQALIASVAVGDEVISTGGLYGRIRRIEDETVVLEVADGVEVRLARAAIGRRIEPEPIDAGLPDVEADGTESSPPTPPAPDERP